jgi:hypothetical protein
MQLGFMRKPTSRFSGAFFLHVLHPTRLIKIQTAILLAPAKVTLIRYPASRQASDIDFPCAVATSIWQSSTTTCSALNLFFGVIKAPFQVGF